jgi:hypothetical protein
VTLLLLAFGFLVLYLGGHIILDLLAKYIEICGPTPLG